MVYYFHCQINHGFSLRVTLVSLLSLWVFRASDKRVSRDSVCLFKQTNLGFRPLSPSKAALDQWTMFWPSHLPFGDEFCFLPSLSYDLLPLQNLASHNLVSQRQSVVVLTVKMVYYSKSFEYTLLCMQVINPVYMTINGYVFPKLLPDWFSADI